MNEHPAQNDKVIRKSNAIARARWSPDSIWEPRLIAVLASKINSNDTYLQTYDIPIVEIIGKNPGGNDYLQFEKAIEKAVDKVMSRVITIRNNNDWDKYPLFSSCKYRSKKGILTIGIHHELKEHFLQLQQYIKYNLTEFMLLPSIYSQRIFEILKSWSDKNAIIINLNELHEMLESPKSFKNSYKDFRRFVLEKAHKDINEQTALKYTWEPIKTGRAVTAIKFIFTKEIPPHHTNNTPCKTNNKYDTPKTTETNNSYQIFASFFNKFNNNDSTMLRIEAHKLWMILNQSGMAPHASDVSDDNTLTAIGFLKRWENTRK